MALELTRLSPALGAEVHGVDVTRRPDDALAARLLGALGEHGILLFRRARITASQHIAFSRAFGELEAHVVSQFAHPDHPQIFVVSNVMEQGRPIGAVRAGQYWHSDLSYVARPSLGSLLHCLEMPRLGGDTLWASMYAAFDALSAPLREFLCGLRAVHEYAHAYDTFFAHHAERPPLTPEQRAKVPPVEHPAVRTHPGTGRRALFVNPGFTTRFAGMSEAESRPILDFLFAHAVRPEFVYRHRWQPDDLVFWDNRCTMHYAVDDYDGSARRHMHRTTVAGDVPR